MDQNNYKYKTMIGVGGIGAGTFFLLNGNHTIGREESRSGRFLIKNDYCKLHIISHYVKILLGAGFKVLPIGKVGDDEIGKKLLNEMNDIGLAMDYIETDKNNPTLYSFCFLYPDMSGGNMTTDNSASSMVDPGFVSKAEIEFAKHEGKGIALAVPEVPIDSRLKLLELAAKYNFFSVASFTSVEISEIDNRNAFEKINLLCVNLEEAASILKINSNNLDAEQIVKSVSWSLSSINPSLLISVSNGKEGSYLWDGKEIFFKPSINVNVVSTAGAGDAFTSGLIAGITAGLTLSGAQELATLTAASSVTSPHTINKELNRKSLISFAQRSNSSLSNQVINFLKD